jgi:hypothetical protein
VQPIQSLLNPPPGGRALKGQEFSLAGSFTQRLQVIFPSPTGPDLVMAFPVQNKFGSFCGTLTQPGYECGIALQGPATVPIRNYEERRHDVLLQTEVPQSANT